MTKIKITTKDIDGKDVYYYYDDLLHFIVSCNNTSIATLGNIIRDGCSESTTYKYLKLQKIGYKKYTKTHPNGTKIECLIEKLKNSENIQTNEQQKVIDNIIDYMKKPDFLHPINSENMVRSYSIIALQCMPFYSLIFEEFNQLIKKYKDMKLSVKIFLGYCGFCIWFFRYMIVMFFDFNNFIFSKMLKNRLNISGEKTTILSLLCLLVVTFNILAFTYYSFNKYNVLALAYLVIYIITFGVVTYISNA